jgi:hypothetical protein
MAGKCGGASVRAAYSIWPQPSTTGSEDCTMLISIDRVADRARPRQAHVDSVTVEIVPSTIASSISAFQAARVLQNRARGGHQGDIVRAKLARGSHHHHHINNRVATRRGAPSHDQRAGTGDIPCPAARVREEVHSLDERLSMDTLSMPAPPRWSPAKELGAGRGRKCGRWWKRGLNADARLVHEDERVE